MEAPELVERPRSLDGASVRHVGHLREVLARDQA